MQLQWWSSAFDGAHVDAGLNGAKWHLPPGRTRIAKARAQVLHALRLQVQLDLDATLLVVHRQLAMENLLLDRQRLEAPPILPLMSPLAVLLLLVDDLLVPLQWVSRVSVWMVVQAWFRAILM